MDWDRILLPYKQAADELTAKFNNISLQFNKLEHTSPIFHVEARIKTVPSILTKAQRKKIPMDEIEGLQMPDIAGVRIICRFVDDIGFVVDTIKSREDMKVLEDRDYVTMMKPSGYRGRHLIVVYPVITAFGKKDVLCEIQIRTLAMNMWAVTEHSLRYKYDGMIPEEIHRRLIRTADAAYMLDTDTNIIREDILEAERSNESREEIVFYITKSIQDLYEVADAAEVEELYKKFVAIMDTKDDESLAGFYNEMQAIAQAYKIR
ncbi:MAG: GTP pyrophosphokinase family protein [Defluviitaleaceae bacterium]|nr:GTP pyrophosphokinase family protein [Defluviitaleaceae bacterium]